MQPAFNSIKEKIHKKIECIDDENFLQAFYTILNEYKNEAEDHELTDEQWEVLKKRETDYLSGKDKGISFEEHIQMTKEKYGF